MRWLDAVTGRRRQAANNLDALFLVPSAAITLETAAGYAPRPSYRPVTKFENRGIKLGHGVWDLVFRLRETA